MLDLSYNKNIVVSICIIINAEFDFNQIAIDELVNILAKSFQHYEIVVIINGSTPDTVDTMRRQLAVVSNNRLVVLSKRNDEEVALTAALECSIGDYVVVMDLATDPPELIPQMISLCISGKDIVIGQITNLNLKPLRYRLLTQMFYILFNLLSAKRIESEWSRFICLSRSMVNSIVQVKDRVRYLKSLNSEIGYTRGIITYEQRQRQHKDSQRFFWESLKFAIETIIASSDRLIRFATLLSFIVSIINVFYIGFALIIWIFKPNVAPGWASISIILAIMFASLFLVLAIFGEYLSVVFKETRKGPLYHIAREYSNSDLFKEISDKNIA